MRKLFKSNDIQDQLKKQPEWISLLPKDPRIHLLTSGETFTIYRTLVDLFEIQASHSAVKITRKEMLQDPMLLKLIEDMPDWETEVTKAHFAIAFHADYERAMVLQNISERR